jgi:hypothetical protein
VGLVAVTAFSPPPIVILMVPHGKDNTGLYPPLKVYLYRVSLCKFIINTFSDTCNGMALWTA